MGYCAGTNPQLSHFTPISIFTSYSPRPSCLMKNSYRSLEARNKGKLNGSLRAYNPRSGNDSIHGSRRPVIFLGLFTLPFFHLSAGALERFPPSVAEFDSLRETELVKTKEEEVSESSNLSSNLRTTDSVILKEAENEESTSQNIFLPLLNEVGIFGFGVLASLYTLAQRDKETAESRIESLNSEIARKEGSMISLKKDMESELVKEKEKWNNLLLKSKDEQQNLLKQLSSAKSNLNSLGNDLSNGKLAMERLKSQINALNLNLSKSREIKDSIETQFKESVKSVKTLEDKVILLERDLQLKKEDIQSLRRSADKTIVQINQLNDKHAATKDELEKAMLVIETLKDDLVESNNGFKTSQALVDDQRSALTSLQSEKAEIHERLIALQDDYNDLESTFKTKAAYDAEQLKKTEEERSSAEETLHLAVIELDEKKATIINLQDELGHCKELLELESANLQKLREGLQSAQEAFAAEASKIENELKEINTKYSSLEQENTTLLSQLSDYEERINLYEKEMKIKEALTGEVNSMHEQLQKVSDDLTAMSHTVEVSTQDNENLQKQLEAINGKAVSLLNELEVETATVSNMRNEREKLEEQVASSNVAVKKLEGDVAEAKELLGDMKRNAEEQVASSNDAIMKLENDLAEAKELLDQMKRNAEVLTGQAEEANSQMLRLQAENEVLMKTLEEQNSAIETLSSFEDAHDTVVALEKERDSLQMKSTMLEEELASAKGEILRLRIQRKAEDVGAAPIDSAKKFVRRKKD